MTIVLGLLGKKGSGKDTLARFLVEDHGYVRYAFADVVKEAALALDPLVGYASVKRDRDSTVVTAWDARLSEVVEYLGWEEAKQLPEVRRTIQRLGTEVGRDIIGEQTWISILGRRIWRDDKPVVITDVRFPNEAAAVSLDWWGYTCRVIRPTLAVRDDATSLHLSETALDGYNTDFTVWNDGSIEDMRHKATGIDVAVRMAHEVGT